MIGHKQESVVHEHHALLFPAALTCFFKGRGIDTGHQFRIGNGQMYLSLNCKQDAASRRSLLMECMVQAFFERLLYVPHW